jgi:hypothetical protein
MGSRVGRRRDAIACVPLALSWFALVLAPAVAQTIDDGDTHRGAGAEQRKPTTVTMAVAGDGGRDRIAFIGMQRGAWEFQTINRVSPDGQSGYNVLLAGRRIKVSRRVDVILLAGPYRTIEHHAWDEVVVDTDFSVHGERFQATLINHWGFPSASSGERFDSHTQRFTGLPHVPKWLGVNLMESRDQGGLERLFIGPWLAAGKGGFTFSAFPFWDAPRKRADLRLGIAYTHTMR